MAPPKISVVITLYGREQLLQQALYMLSQQTYDNWEALVVADGPHKAAKFAYHIFCNRHGCGPSMSGFHVVERQEGTWGNPIRRFGMEHATGDYIVWYGHDCLIDKDYLATHAHQIQMHGGPCISVVGVDYWTPQPWARADFPNYKPSSDDEPLYVRSIIPPPDGRTITCGNIDLLSFCSPIDVARKYAFRPANDKVYEGDWLSFSAMRNHLPVVTTPKIVCSHF